MENAHVCLIPGAYYKDVDVTPLPSLLDSHLHNSAYTQHHDVPPRRGYFVYLECNFHILPSMAPDHGSYLIRA